MDGRRWPKTRMPSPDKWPEHVSTGSEGESDEEQLAGMVLEVASTSEEED